MKKSREKFGIRIPINTRQALIFDKENGNTKVNSIYLGKYFNNFSHFYSKKSSKRKIAQIYYYDSLPICRNKPAITPK